MRGVRKLACTQRLRDPARRRLRVHGIRGIPAQERSELLAARHEAAQLRQQLVYGHRVKLCASGSGGRLIGGALHKAAEAAGGHKEGHNARHLQAY